MDILDDIVATADIAEMETGLVLTFSEPAAAEGEGRERSMLTSELSITAWRKENGTNQH